MEAEIRTNTEHWRQPPKWRLKYVPIQNIGGNPRHIAYATSKRIVNVIA